jgi:hypothetical protein
MLRVLRRSVLHYALPPAAPAPEVLGVMAPVRPRRRVAPAGADFSLHTFTPCMTACPRRRVNAQVRSGVGPLVTACEQVPPITCTGRIMHKQKPHGIVAPCHTPIP